MRKIFFQVTNKHCDTHLGIARTLDMSPEKRTRKHQYPYQTFVPNAGGSLATIARHIPYGSIEPSIALERVACNFTDRQNKPAAFAHGQAVELQAQSHARQQAGGILANYLP